MADFARAELLRDLRHAAHLSRESLLGDRRAGGEPRPGLAGGLAREARELVAAAGGPAAGRVYVKRAKQEA